MSEQLSLGCGGLRSALLQPSSTRSWVRSHPLELHQYHCPRSGPAHFTRRCLQRSASEPKAPEQSLQITGPQLCVLQKYLGASESPGPEPAPKDFDSRGSRLGVRSYSCSKWKSCTCRKLYLCGELYLGILKKYSLKAHRSMGVIS